jgi:hypothetical protein
MCSSFVEALLNQIGADTNRKAFSNNIVDIFDAVRKQGGFGQRAMSDTAERGKYSCNGDAYINIGNGRSKRLTRWLRGREASR